MEEFKDAQKTEELLNEINEDIRKELSEERYKHSVGVMKKAEELAEIYKVNSNEAKLVGLAHDIAKEMDKDAKLKYVEENNIKIDEIEKINIGLLHGKIGADICKKRYGFSTDMQKAIEYHTTGNPNMDILAKIIFVADKIEEGRNYSIVERQEELEKLRQISAIDINKAVLIAIDESIIYTIQKGRLIHPDGIATRNKLISEKL